MSFAPELEAVERTEMQREVRRFARNELDAARSEREGCQSAKSLEAARALGLFGVTIPERWGGLGLSLAETIPIIAMLAEHDRSFATMLGLHAGLGTRALVELGDDALRDLYLPRLARGEWIAAFAATEPGAGSDLGAIRTEVCETKSGRRTLRGEKCYVTNGGFADVATVLARTPGRGGSAGFALVVVRLDAPGVERGREEDKLGLRASSTVSLSFDDVVVEPGHVLGRPGGGLDDAQRALSWGRTLMAAGCVGAARTALALTSRHVNERIQFGRRIIELELVRSRLADMVCRLHAMETVVRRVGALAEREHDIGLGASVAKVVCSEGCFTLADEAIQLHGGQGFLEDGGVPRLLRDCRVTRIFEGANDVLVIHLATRLLVTPSSDLELARAGEHPHVERLRAALLERLATLRRTTGARAARQQVLLEGLGRARIALFVADTLGVGDGSLATRARLDWTARGEMALRSLDGAAERASCASAVLLELGILHRETSRNLSEREVA